MEQGWTRRPTVRVEQRPRAGHTYCSSLIYLDLQRMEPKSTQYGGANRASVGQHVFIVLQAKAPFDFNPMTPRFTVYSTMILNLNE
jgi:hypothetical protein